MVQNHRISLSEPCPIRWKEETARAKVMFFRCSSYVLLEAPMSHQILSSSLLLGTRFSPYWVVSGHRKSALALVQADQDTGYVYQE